VAPVKRVLQPSVPRFQRRAHRIRTTDGNDHPADRHRGSHYVHPRTPRASTTFENGGRAAGTSQPATARFVQRCGKAHPRDGRRRHQDAANVLRLRGSAPQANTLLVYAKVDPTTIELVDGFTRDVSKIGHHGTGDLEIQITDNVQLSQAEPLIAMSYASS
jgi:hypothetical protein